MTASSFALLAGGIALLADPSGGQAQGQSEQEKNREEGFFGGATPATNNSVEDDIFGSNEDEEDKRVSDLESRLEQGLEDTADWLELGGQLYSRFEYQAKKKGSPKQFALSAPTLADIFLDTRPTERLRGFLRGRVSHDFSAQGSGEAQPNEFGGPKKTTEVLLDQVWLKFDIGRRLYVTLGKQPIRWGTGRFWNPTDFLNRQRRDPLAIFEERTGIGLVKLHLPIESLGWNLYAIANIDQASKAEEVGGAFRAEFLVGQTAIDLSYAKRKNNPHQVGLDISTGIGLFDLKAEIAGLYGVQTPFYRGSLSLPTMTVPTAVYRDQEWILQGTLGGEVAIRYSDQDNILFGVEYFYNDAGTRNTQIYPWLFANNAFEPLYVGRHYAAAYALLQAPGNWNNTSFTLSGLGNLSDESYLVRFDYQVLVLTHLNFNAYTAVHFGKNGEMNLGTSIAPLPDDQLSLVPEDSMDPNTYAILRDGLFVAQPAFELGVALRINF